MNVIEKKRHDGEFCSSPSQCQRASLVCPEEEQRRKKGEKSVPMSTSDSRPLEAYIYGLEIHMSVCRCVAVYMRDVREKISLDCWNFLRHRRLAKCGGDKKKKKMREALQRAERERRRRGRLCRRSGFLMAVLGKIFAVFFFKKAQLRS